MNGLPPAILLSLRVAVMATIVASLIAIPLAFIFARRRFFGKPFAETLLTVPLVLPPTVIGYLLIVVLGRNSIIGNVIERLFGSGVLFTTAGAVIASAVVALPLMYLPAKAAFASVDRELEEIARLMGANPVEIFWHVSLPIARRGIGSGVLLAFARSLGEFGATVMVLGISPNRQTLPISIYMDYEAGEMSRAAPAVIVLAAVSLLVILIYTRSLRAGHE